MSKADSLEKQMQQYMSEREESIFSKYAEEENNLEENTEQEQVKNSKKRIAVVCLVFFLVMALAIVGGIGILKNNSSADDAVSSSRKEKFIAGENVYSQDGKYHVSGGLIVKQEKANNYFLSFFLEIIVPAFALFAVIFLDASCMVWLIYRFAEKLQQH